jgi:hypothetical protein
MPKNWILGQIGGIFVDKDDNVWISQRPRTVNDRDKRAERGDKSICCYTAPSVVEFNQAGDVVKAWGGPKTAEGYDWPQNEHGMFIDYKGNVWLGGNGENDGMVLKFTNDGKFLMSIGKSAKQTNSLIKCAGRAADMVVDQATNELYVADGYFNHRRRFEPTPARSSAPGVPMASRRQTRRSPMMRRFCRSSSTIRCTASGSPPTGRWWFPTAATTASRCSRRTVPFCAKSRSCATRRGRA